jgi:hypothetical protein
MCNPVNLYWFSSGFAHTAKTIMGNCTIIKHGKSTKFTAYLHTANGIKVTSDSNLNVLMNQITKQHNSIINQFLTQYVSL